MNKIFERIGVLLAIAIIAIASPAIATPEKQFSLSVQASPVYTVPPSTTPVPATTLGAQVTAPVKVVATFTNLAPPSTASSNISSLSLSMAVPGMSIVTQVGTTPYPPTGTIDGVATGTINASSPTTITVSNLSPLKGLKSYVLTFYVSSCGDTTWTGTAYTGSQFNGSAFNLKTPVGDPSLSTLVACGIADCANPNQAPFSVVDTTILSTLSSAAFLTGVQGPYNKDGVCGPSTYFVSNLVPLNGAVHFRWPVAGTGAQPTAAFAYDITLPTSTTPKVGWLNLDGSPATNSNGTDNPVFIAPPLCASTNLPSPYGTLNNSISKTATQIKVNATRTPPATPFDMVIGLERMTVTSIQGGGPWRVTRAVGGTAGANHPASAFAMSTPLPILQTTPAAVLGNGTVVPAASSPYQAGEQAQVCKLQDTIDNGDGTWTTPLIDIGDAYMKPST